MAATRFIFRSQGDAVAFIEDGHVFALDGQAVGFVDARERVYDRAGQYKGFLLRDGRVALNSDEIVPPVKPPPLREQAKARPLAIPQRLSMPPLRAPMAEAIVVEPFEPERRVGFPATVIAIGITLVGAVVAAGSFLARSDGSLSASLPSGKMLAGLTMLAVAMALVASMAGRRSRTTQSKVIVLADIQTAPSILDELAGKGERLAHVVETIDLAQSIHPDLSRVAALLKAKRVDKVVVSDTRSVELRQLRALVGERDARRVQAASDFISDRTGRVPLSLLNAAAEGNWGRVAKPGSIQRVAKRCFDVITSTLLLIFQAPVLLLTAIAIKLDSPGPLLYRQERLGANGRTFRVLKFRSMRVNTEEDGVARWATKSDPRVTRVGAFIRATRIDEIPQLFCVLRGDMSMVGPRPERPSFAEELRRAIPGYDLRNLVQPGITGWSQVMYSYGASLEDARTKLEYDLYYVKNRSLYLDFLILFWTVQVVLFSEGSR